LKTHFSRSIKVFGYYLAIFIISVFLIETARIIEAQVAIDSMADSGVRYASTGRYEICNTRASLDYAVELLKTQNISITTDELLSMNGCSSPDYKFEYAAIDGARYVSILKVIRAGTPPIIDARYLKIIICSDHSGFTYDKNNDTCYPMEYPGRQYWYIYHRKSDLAFVSLTYEYPFGSSLGLDLLKIRLHVFHEKALENYR